jgi:hypothetical protein
MRPFAAAALAAALLPAPAPAQTADVQDEIEVVLYRARLRLPPTLNMPAGPKLERIDGWVPLFDGGTADAWRWPDGSKWHVYKGLLYPEGNKPALLVSRSAYPDYELSVVYYKRPGNKVRLLLHCDAEGRNAAASVSARYLGRNWGELRVGVVGGRVRGADYRAEGVVLDTGNVEEGDKPDNPRPGHVALSGSGILIRSVHIRPLDKKEGRP